MQCGYHAVKRAAINITTVPWKLCDVGISLSLMLGALLNNKSLVLSDIP